MMQSANQISEADHIVIQGLEAKNKNTRYLPKASYCSFWGGLGLRLGSCLIVMN